jgi:nitroreductase
VWTVQPAWWVEHYRSGVDDLVAQGLIDPARAGELLETMAVAPDPRGLGPALMGDAMLAVAAVLLAAVDAGLGAGLAGCRPGALARALELPGHARIVPYGVLALGYAADAGATRPRKPALADVVYEGLWGRPVA